MSFDHSGTWLATGARRELKIWKHLPASTSSSTIESELLGYIMLDRLQYIGEMAAPRRVTAMVAPHEPILITSLHWLRYGKDAGCLVVTYLYHGIMCAPCFLVPSLQAFDTQQLLGSSAW